MELLIFTMFYLVLLPNNGYPLDSCFVHATYDMRHGYNDSNQCGMCDVCACVFRLSFSHFILVLYFIIFGHFGGSPGFRSYLKFQVSDHFHSYKDT